MYLRVYKKRCRRKNKIIAKNNNNFICAIGWSESNLEAAKQCSIPEEIRNEMDNTEIENIYMAWNPSFAEEED